MIHILIGAAAMAGLLFLVDYSRKKKINVRWWQWLITIPCFIYSVFVAEMIVAFLDESAGKAALVMGLIFGFVAIIWAVLLARFVFSGAKK